VTLFPFVLPSRTCMGRPGFSFPLSAIVKWFPGRTSWAAREIASRQGFGWQSELGVSNVACPIVKMYGRKLRRGWEPGEVSAIHGRQ
jgi:hypothetical protein